MPDGRKHKYCTACHTEYARSYRNNPTPRRQDMLTRAILGLVICEPTTMATGCWEWSNRDKDGYGIIKIKGKNIRVHRVIYEHFVGPIPDDLQPDHLCRNRACSNFEHLEIVTARENTLRSNCVSAINARKTHCIKGHPLSGDNLYVYDEGRKRQCRQCSRERYRRRAKGGGDNQSPADNETGPGI